MLYTYISMYNIYKTKIIYGEYSMECIAYQQAKLK